MEKNRLEKVRKHVFYKHTNIETKKWGKKREEKIVKKHTNRVSKNFWKIIVWKKCENTFFINNEYRDEKSGGKNARKIFFKKTHGYREIKTREKKRFGKSSKIRFL